MDSININNITARDSRRSSTTINAFPRCHNPTISLQRSSQEGEVELQETVRLSGKRERDRDHTKPSSKRRGSYSHTTKTFKPTPPLPPPLPYDNITREIIGVPVPRKARSGHAKRAACVKKTHESWVPATLEQQSLNSTKAASPSSFVADLQKNMKSSGTKTRLPKVSKSSPSTQGDLEMQVAELLSGLKDIDSLELRTTSLSSHPSSDAEKKNVEDKSSSSQTQNDSNQSAEVEKMLSPESAKVLACRDVGNASDHEIGSPEATKECNEEHKLNSGAGFSVAPDGRSEEFTRESPSKSKLDLDKQEDSASTKNDPVSLVLILLVCLLFLRTRAKVWTSLRLI